MKKILLAASAALCAASAASAQPYPANGYIGVFSDQAGTLCCSTVDDGPPVLLYVLFRPAGMTAGGITGAEFRLELSQPVPGAVGFANWMPDPAASVAIGNPIDPTPNQDPTPPATEGVQLGFTGCQGMGGGVVVCGTIQVLDFSTMADIPSIEILTKRASPPSNPIAADCPVVTICDGPVFTKVCLTIPTGPHGESINFRSGLNNVSCNTSCLPVAVAAKSWTAMKELYRN